MQPNLESTMPITPDAASRVPSASGRPSRRAELIDICETMMRLRQVGDFTQLANYLTEDCELLMPGLPGMCPFAGTAHGRDDCVAAMRANFTVIEMIDLVALNFIHDGDSVVVSWSAQLRNRGTGPAIEVNGLSRLCFRGKQISLYANYLDTAALAALAGFQGDMF
jgi:ketosteroid isomerase-like protein